MKKLSNLLHQSQARTSVSKIFKRQLILVADNHQTFTVGLTKRTLWPDSLIQKRFYQIAHPSYVEWNCQIHLDSTNTSEFLSLISSFSTQRTENQTGTWVFVWGLLRESESKFNTVLSESKGNIFF